MDFLSFYQNLPLAIDPIAFNIGFFSLTWYSLMYLVAFLVIYLLLQWRIKNDYKNSSDFSNISKNIENFFIYAIIGLVVGARLGYVIFYDPYFFLVNPWQVISPFDTDGNFVGIYGLSYHGGLAGIILAGIFFVRKYRIYPSPSSEITNIKKQKSIFCLFSLSNQGERRCGINFWVFADFVIPAIPLGYFFGRVGNFLNGELYGRLTDKFWGMYFLDENSVVALRHPSQLYEALFEGIILFLILWFLRNNPRLSGNLLPLYVFLYGFFRFVIEFWRQPDTQIGLIFNFLSLGQIFSIGMMIIAISGWIFVKRSAFDSQMKKGRG